MPRFLEETYLPIASVTNCTELTGGISDMSCRYQARNNMYITLFSASV